MTVEGQRVYLIGFMGAGKTTVAEQLSEQTGWPIKELDNLIERRAGKTIPEIFTQQGEIEFRQLETAELRRVARQTPPLIISCGGGVPLAAENREIMRRTGQPVYLYVSPEVAWQRVSGDENRPLAQSRQQFFELWEEREPLYSRFTTRIDTTDKTPKEIAKKMLTLL